MRTIAGVVSVFAVVVAIGLGLDWASTGNDFFLYKYFAPRQEQVRRQVFETSRAFNQGMIQELENMQVEYARGNKEQRETLRSIIVHRASGFDLEQADVPSDLRNFIEDLREQYNSSQ